jgi:hypothetical protein
MDRSSPYRLRLEQKATKAVRLAQLELGEETPSDQVENRALEILHRIEDDEIPLRPTRS